MQALGTRGDAAQCSFASRAFLDGANRGLLHVVDDSLLPSFLHLTLVEPDRAGRCFKLRKHAHFITRCASKG